MWQQNVRVPSLKTATNVVNKLSEIFQPTSALPKDATIKYDIRSKSQRLMMELGVIKPSNPGSFHFLPLGVRALEKLTRLVDREMSKIGAQKVIMPTLTNSKLWKATGRLNNASSELFTLKDRHNIDYILSPTHEESVTDLITSLAHMTYKQFPLKLYQITSKFRDEMKPRFGLIRGREFIMKDMYSFDVDVNSAHQTYQEVCDCYTSIFKKIGVEFVQALGSNGTMGGSLSHEFHYAAAIGEDLIMKCGCGYMANVDLSGSEVCPRCKKSENVVVENGIEVGHTFFLGDKYSKSLKATYLTEKSQPVILQMGSYGLGISRILAAAIEVLSAEQEMRWPVSLAPFTAIIIPPKSGSKEESTTSEMPEKIYNSLNAMDELEGNILLDDRRHLTIGRRLLDARRFGYPYIIVIGSKAAQDPPLVELIDLHADKHLFFTESELLNYFNKTDT